MKTKANDRKKNVLISLIIIRVYDPVDGWVLKDICLAGLSRRTCEKPDSRISISFNDIEISRCVLVHLIIV
jgi:hypothetical protein